ncbi:C6 transcription factor rosa [Aspergillus japonicus CBS 114.51]|nr:C6 transcription factor rosa [Aspergillus japonicus CBS 114.51]RAH78496.1 C6 transcription factor rosa [Aspergillus japonicus CBS 114.51]
MSHAVASSSSQPLVDDGYQSDGAASDISDAPIEENEAIVKSYRRSRSGCFICRLRRKKCDETRPVCASCSKLSLKCDYKMPHWWQNPELRRRQMDMIKKRVRQTRIMKKEGNLEEYMNRVRALAQKPPMPVEFSFNQPAFLEQQSALLQSLPTSAMSSGSQSKAQQDNLLTSAALPLTPSFFPSSTFNQSSLFTQGPVLPTPPAYPQTLCLPPTPVSALPTATFGTPSIPQLSTFTETPCPLQAQSFAHAQSVGSACSLPSKNSMGVAQLSSGALQLPGSSWLPPIVGPPQPGSQQPSNQLSNALSLLLGGYRPLSESLRSLISVEDRDRPLLDHFVDNVLHTLFPLLGLTQASSLHTSEILYLMQTNRSYLHCCLSMSAIHLKNSMRLEDQMDFDIVQHRYAAISQLSRLLNRGTGHIQVMDATLGLIFYHCSAGTSDDYLPDIPWNQHFRAVSDLVKKLNCTPSQFNISLIAWIDIIGATMLGTTPEFAHTYRTKHLSGISSGLQQMMGCDDRVMYLISEITCLESLYIEGRVDDMSLFQHVSALNSQINWTEPSNPAVESPYTSEGVLKPEQLTKIVTALFRIAARIYVHSILPTFDSYDPIIMSWITSVGEILQCIPAGPTGFDRCLVWPLFIAGIYSVPASHFRKTIAERVAALGFLGHFGSISRMYRVLKQFWRVADETASFPGSGTKPRKHQPAPALTADGVGVQPAEQCSEEGQYPHEETKNHIHWREIMRKKKWNYLLM